MQSIGKIVKSNKGYSLITVMIYFMILAILAASAMFVSMSYTKQVINQREYIQAYYLAFSGAEIGYSALFVDDEDLLDQFRTIPNKTLEDEINMDAGKISIKVKAIEDNEKVVIESIGTTGNGKSYTLFLMFYADVPNIKKYSTDLEGSI